MNLLGLIGISDALAAASNAQPAAGGLASLLPMILVFVIGAYFLMIRPQNRRIKAHRKLVSELAKGDEVVTVGGVVGKIAKISDDFLTITIADNVDISIQKSAVANVLPKGTIKAIA
jgi:preprotein translocase subunit YajC